MNFFGRSHCDSGVGEPPYNAGYNDESDQRGIYSHVEGESRIVAYVAANDGTVCYGIVNCSILGE